MNKKVIFIGLGVVALGGLAFFLFRKKSGGAGATDAASAAARAADVPTGTAPTYDESIYDDTALASPSVPPSRREIRRNCKDEAKAKGLKRLTRARREFMRECKAAGGENVDFMSEQSDFAFNGYGDF
jgi:hypothetical protein